MTDQLTSLQLCHLLAFCQPTSSLTYGLLPRHQKARLPIRRQETDQGHTRPRETNRHNRFQNLGCF